MRRQDYGKHGSHRQKDDVKCKEPDTPTRKSIVAVKENYCTLIYEQAGEVDKWEESYESHSKVYREKRCLFLHVEKNYRYFRNFNITIGTEFMTTNETIRDNITSYNAKNTELAATLDQISVAVKSLKENMKILHGKAGDLEICRDDSCNESQWKVLTQAGDQPQEKGNERQHRHKELCKDIGQKFNELIDIPKVLVKDVDSVFKSASDVRGIQVFINLDSLEPKRKELSESAQALNNHMKASMEVREKDLKAVQEELTGIIAQSTRANISRYGARSNFEGTRETLEILCCPGDYCKCVGEKGITEERLQDCKDEICQICSDVKKVYCKDDDRPRRKDRKPEQERKENY